MRTERSGQVLVQPLVLNAVKDKKSKASRNILVSCRCRIAGREARHRV